MNRLRRFPFENALTLVFLALLVAALIGPSITPGRPCAVEWAVRR